MDLSLNLRDARTAFERDYLVTKIRRMHGNVTKIAKDIGCEREHAQRLIRKHGLQNCVKCAREDIADNEHTTTSLITTVTPVMEFMSSFTRSHPASSSH